MARYIDVDKVTYNKIKESSLIDDLTDRELQTVIQVFRNIPTEDVKPIVYGEWIDVGLYVYECSNCYNSLEMWWEDKYKFCPNCGADMRKESEDNE